VTLSGEGADEFFGGYALPLEGAAAWIAQTPSDADGGMYEAIANSWVRPDAKSALLNDDLARAIDDDAALFAWYGGVYREEHVAARGLHAAATASDVRLAAHLGVHQRINLEGLLRRLDTSTMAASVEGRTPLADTAVAHHARGLAMDRRFSPAPGMGSRTKIALREAFEGVVPASIAARPKASFPLPFQPWMADAAPRFAASPFARAVFSQGAIERIARDPASCWNEAWPAMNLAIWGDHWFG
jgi:asparagine synthase (glutamine-hydrolysing)